MLRDRRGSAIILAILLLVLLNAIGMYAVSYTVPAVENRQYYHSAVAKNMARAGAHAAIARLPDAFPGEVPYVRRITIGPESTGSYEVTSRRAGLAQAAPGVAKGVVFEDYAIQSVGRGSSSPASTARVEAQVRIALVPDGQTLARARGMRARILKWDEYGR